MDLSNLLARLSGAPEKSAGGSNIIRYKASEWESTKFGVGSEATARAAEMRAEAYARHFGEAVSVSHEVLPLVPHVDIMEYSRLDGKMTVLVTSGMSDLPMKTPRGADVPRRVELIFYVSKMEQAHLDLMRRLAHFPHDQKTWIGAFHTMPLEAMFGSRDLNTVLLLPAVIKKDQEFDDQLIIDGDTVNLLWVVPITKAECDLKLKKGSDALMDLFEINRHPPVFNPQRASYV